MIGCTVLLDILDTEKKGLLTERHIRRKEPYSVILLDNEKAIQSGPIFCSKCLNERAIDDNGQGRTVDFSPYGYCSWNFKWDTA